MFDTAYIQKKEKGLISFTKIGNKVMCTVKRFNAETGEAVPDETFTVNIEEFKSQIKLLKERLANLQAAQDDIKALIA
jgi:hypothetical protein